MHASAAAGLKRFLSRDAGPLAQFVKYVLAGGVATVTHVAVFFLCGRRLLPCLTPEDVVVRLLGLEVPPAAAARARNAAICNVIGFVVANTICYLLNRRFIFVPGRHRRSVEFLLFFAVSATSILLGTAVQSWLIAAHGVQTTPAFGANLAASLAINYLARRFVIFKG